MFFLLLVSSACFGQVMDVKTFERYAKAESGKTVIVETYTYTQFEPPNWKGFKDDISTNSIFIQMYLTLNANGYTTFLDYVNTGILNKRTDTKLFKTYWDAMFIDPNTGIKKELTQSQKDTIQPILTKNFFSVQIQ